MAPRVAKKACAPVAVICLYGTATAGSGWLASAAAVDKHLGNGELKPGRSMTEAVWLAAEALREAGVRKGLVRVFEPNGQLCADVEIGGHVPSFGRLTWKPAPVCVVSAEEIEHAAGER